MEFIYAAELKKRFTCYGHFYELQLMSGERAKCRSVLEIVDSSIPQENPSAISEMEPDVVVIMMNPGSSHPKDAAHVDEVIEYPTDGTSMRKELVLTQPDNTQYQVMRVAVSTGWKHIRVLNLSDLRDPKSGSFLQKVDALTGVMGGHVHSMFCAERATECAHARKRRSPAPILLGWGQDLGLLPLVEQCLQRIEGEPTCTVPSEVHPLLNAHPSPMLQKKKLQWLETMAQALNA
ncbi:DUF1643 domain-containing protein [Pontiella sulfatireligans]|uniref:DUF1643 domain-containing protein n=1 Tax=Pontiella sulfatireligans TaxID=2750658 RepID=A0A6C2ULK1_9BACT|nr:DUF1643 domain-containing protein [Pontiella sulfatireligans]VGO20297.1 hypothetical protein SCARR_02359 [Pontiella sulfatireligans]